MLATLTYIALVITVGITGSLVWRFVRNRDAAMEWATHRLVHLPEVMTGRYIAIFAFAVGVLILNDPAVSVYFFVICTFIGFYDGWVYFSKGYPHWKHTITGVLSLAALLVATANLLTQEAG